MADWHKREEQLNNQIAQFEKNYKHRKPCKRYMETGYCPHIATAQQKKFGKHTTNLMDDLLAISGRA